MYDKRIKIYVILSAALLLVCLLRLIQMQLLDQSLYRDKIAELRLQRSTSRQLRTARGKILDRKNKILATDEPQFWLHINYSLSSLSDDRVKRAKLLKAAKQHDANLTSTPVQKELENEWEDLQQVIDKCTHFGFERLEIEDRIKKKNDWIWNLRTYLAWKRNYPNQDFAQAVPDANDRLLLAAKVDIAEMHRSWSLIELETDDDIFTAQLEFMDIDGVQILPKGHRFYLYGSVAAQTIGWVGRPQERDKKLFANDKLSSYLSDELCGREDGIEYVCETILRGKRGETVYDIDQQLISRTETQLGKDVFLTLDIELQKGIEDYLVNYDHEPNCGPGMAAVIIDVATGDILSLVSMPNFDLNDIREDYGNIADSKNKPLLNRAINEHYPPGSVVKPLILIAGLESGKITPDEIISCPAQKAPKGWPNCWLYNKYSWMGHDDKWANNASNAIKGSCNIYFSRLADRIVPSVLQQWLFKFGYGHKILLPPVDTGDVEYHRNLRQAQGQISDVLVSNTVSDFNDIPPLKKRERRFFGIGQGNLRVTPLQVANAFATIARGGLYKPPRLFIANRTSNHEARDTKYEIQDTNSVALNISKKTLDVVRDGMSAVVNEPGGTAYKEFAHSGFDEQGVKVYGKTGSTEGPDNAWFAGFAEDSKGRSISVAVVVEGGQHGSSDAAPLARDIIGFCIEAEYIGKSPVKMDYESGIAQ